MESLHLMPGCSATDIWGQIMLRCWICPVHCRIFSSIPGLNPLDTSSIIFSL